MRLLELPAHSVGGPPQVYQRWKVHDQYLRSLEPLRKEVYGGVPMTTGAGGLPTAAPAPKSEDLHYCTEIGRGRDQCGSQVSCTEAPASWVQPASEQRLCEQVAASMRELDALDARELS